MRIIKATTTLRCIGGTLIGVDTGVVPGIVNISITNGMHREHGIMAVKEARQLIARLEHITNVAEENKDYNADIHD